MSRSSLPQRLRQDGGELSKSDLIFLFLYHLYIRDWRDYEDFQWEPGPPPEDPERILCVQLSSIGDVAYSQPVIPALRRRWPSADIDFLSEQECSLAVYDHPDLSRCWTYPFQTWDRWKQSGRTESVREEIESLLIDLKAQEYDYVLNLHWSPLSATITRFLQPTHLSGLTLDEDLAPVIHGNPFFGLMFSLKSTNQKLPLNPASKKCLLVDHFGQETTFYQNFGPLSEDVERLVKEQTNQNKLHLLINTGSRMDKRIWPGNHCIKCLQQLDPNRFDIGLIGGPEDEARLDKIQDALSDEFSVIPWYRKTNSLEEDLQLSDHADLTVTSDTGPMNLISIRGNPILDVAGDIWVGPWNQESAVIRDKEGAISKIPPDFWHSLLNHLLTGQPLSKSSGTTTFYRSPLPVSDPWFRHIPYPDREPELSGYRQWESQMLGLELWSRQAREYGWRGVEDLQSEFYRLREIFWKEFKDRKPFLDHTKLDLPGADLLQTSIRDQVEHVKKEWI